MTSSPTTRLCPSSRGSIVHARSAKRAAADEPGRLDHRRALLVRLAPADGDEDPVAVGLIDDIGPAQGAHLAAPHPRHEQQSRDHRVETPALEGDLVGFKPATAPPGPMAPTPAVCSPAGAGWPASFARKHATLGEVGCQGHVVELPPVEPGVETPQRPGVGPAGVLADGSLDEAARGRCGPPDRGLSGVDPGRCIIHVTGKSAEQNDRQLDGLSAPARCPGGPPTDIDRAAGCVPEQPQTMLRGVPPVERKLVAPGRHPD